MVLGASISPAASGWDLLVRTGAGAITLRFSPSLATGLLNLPRVPGFIVPKDDGRRHGNGLSDEKRALYLATYITWKTEGIGQRAACARHKASYYNFQAWIYNHRAECEAALAAVRAPIAKPSGKLL
jgi:hypothetical protein